ncbi:MAG TPA: hypothetical protein VG796_16930 [Verrucomicrobiales bacterium]|nr:hypothetical protein [Verrucomicrobiales bacterium]
MRAAIAFAAALLSAPGSRAELRTEHFDREPAGWEGINNRNTLFEPRGVEQNFGFSAETTHAGGAKGEIGGRINPAGEPAHYGFRLPKRLTGDMPFTAEGKMLVPKGAGHCLMGLYNVETLGGWRTPNTMVARINGRGESFHCHIEYTTARWRAGAGVIGEIVPGSRITPIEVPQGKPMTWKMAYTPAKDGSGEFTFEMAGGKAQCRIEPEHRKEGLTFTHFGLMPVLKSWDSGGEIWLDDLKINGAAFEFAADPGWDASGNRRTYQTLDIRPRFDFGWSNTKHAGGLKPGELGGLVFRGDCREPGRMGCYGDRIKPLSLNGPLEARGRVAVLRAVSDSTASIGFYHSVHSMKSNPSQKNATPMNYLGINIEGPSSEGFFFYPVCRPHGDDTAVSGYDKAPRIYPDGKTHEWRLRYDPKGGNGDGEITMSLDAQTCRMKLPPDFKTTGADFDRFGICTPWIDGNSVIVYFDDLVYTCAP